MVRGQARYWRRILLTGSLCWMVAILPGCSAIMATFGAPTLRDVRVENVEVVRDVLAMPEAVRRNPHLHPVIMVNFTTNRDLSTYGRVYAATFHLTTALCHQDEPDPHRLVSRIGVLTKEGEEIG